MKHITPLSGVSIWDIQNGKDRVYSDKSVQYGTLYVIETRPECLEISVLWDNSETGIIVSQNDKDLFFVK